MSHTPGPWRAEGPKPFWVVRNSEYGLIATIQPRDEAANARLIAAAPGLLEALGELRSLIADQDSPFLEGLRACQAADRLLSRLRGESQ